MHTSLDAGTEYTYRLVAINDLGDSDPSNEVSATTHDVPAAPTGLTATVVSDGEVTLSWTVPSDGGSAITSYKIKQATSSTLVIVTTPTTVAVGDITINVSSASYVVSGLADGAYHFQVAAINNVGQGTYTDPVPATDEWRQYGYHGYRYGYL